ncbi:ATP-binding protein [Pseudooceanicola sp. C21-150M6]|uniref:ATP-binding protein n=1 Tax=Pseudooceanicola sp. C21-150M6 TaxID=3434355 RepID=UPI003D7F1F25
MTSLNLLIFVCLLYVAFLFAVAFGAERAALRGRGKWLRSPLVYTLSLSIYCTAWTFYGAVGYAARSGMEFMTIYLGPSLVMVGWFWAIRKMVRIGRSQNITSVADLISSRYGKSNSLAVLVTVLAVIGTTPYIALQLQSVTLSVAAFSQADPTIRPLGDQNSTALWVACGLAFFTVMFGTRNLDANERHHGVVMAIAVEAVVKLVALLAVGLFVVWGIGGGLGATLDRIDASAMGQWRIEGDRWLALTGLSAAALLCLPRMFQVLVVENEDERHLRTASWAFPLYLLLMSLFVMPIAVWGLATLPEGSNPDLFVLSLPLAEGRPVLAMLSFIGGFSSATSMVIVASLALSTMVSNHIVMPIWLSSQVQGAIVSGDVRHIVMLSRRFAIVGMLALGYLYYRVSGGGAALAAIGLISFSGVAQFLPPLIGGMFWRGANKTGALTGLALGGAVWLWCLFLPSFGAGVVLPASVWEAGPLGLGWLRPWALFGIEGMDPLVHGVFWSILINTLGFVGVSLFTFPTPMERLQGAQFVNVFDHTGATRGWSGGMAQSEDLMIMAQRILGPEDAQALFRRAAAVQGLQGYLPEPTPDFLRLLERELSGSVGAATAHAMIGQITGGTSVSVDDLMAVADEAAQIMEYSSQLEAKSQELQRTARQLRAANDKLTTLSVQKDAFLSQISHELRTPMTSIRAFSEILRDAAVIEPADKDRYAGIIHDEAIRLTRLLDDLLDLSVLENGQVSLNLRQVRLGQILDRAVSAAGVAENDLSIRREGAEDALLVTDADRLCQVFINLISNAAKYCDAVPPELVITARLRAEALQVDFIDNGSGLDVTAQDMIFEKFSRVGEQKAGGAGLGLAICREIMTRLGGTIIYLPGQEGAAFRVTVPVAAPRVAE